MATVFPFNKVSKLPSIIIKHILNILFKQQQLILDLILSMDSFSVSMSKNAKCDDAEVTALKNKLAELQTAIDNLNAILNVLPPITNAFRTISTIATVLSTIQLAIPTVPPAPQGPIAQTISSFADLIANVDACTATLNNIITMMNSFSQQIGESIAKAQDKISNVCQTQPTNQTELNNDIASQFDQSSIFYRSVNVSDADLSQRLQTIQDLIDNGLDVLSSLNEAPSKVIVGTGTPANTIGQPGDYYIDTTNQTVLGPKPQTNIWN